MRPRRGRAGENAGFARQGRLVVGVKEREAGVIQRTGHLVVPCLSVLRVIDPRAGVAFLRAGVVVMMGVEGESYGALFEMIEASDGTRPGASASQCGQQQTRQDADDGDDDKQLDEGEGPKRTQA